MKRVETVFEKTLFASRWLMAPFYAGLAGSLVLLLASFCQELWHLVLNVGSLTPADTVLGALSLIDLSLAGNLLLIVIFSGYENFVSKLNIDEGEDKFEWRGTVDFATLKLKLIASIVAISGIHLLKTFMDVSKHTKEDIMWMVIIHMIFVISGVLMALMDKLAVSAKAMKKK
jgi:uncharacterized protein (TIGR00645 family)